MYTLPESVSEAQAIVSHCQFKPFDNMDWDMWAGADNDPYICYLEDESETGMAVINEGHGQRYHFCKQADTGEIMEVTWDVNGQTVSHI